MNPQSETLRAALELRREAITAMLLSTGMLAAAAAILLLAGGWRRCALLAGLAYSLTLCFIPVGFAPVLGPLTSAVALAGLLWPRSSRRLP